MRIRLSKGIFDDLCKLLDPNYNCSKKIRKDEKLGFFGYYQGCKMFENNTIPYGEVELR